MIKSVKIEPRKGDVVNRLARVCMLGDNLIFHLTLGSDDQTVFECFRVIFSLKKKPTQCPLSFNLYLQQKRAPKLSISHLPTKRSV